jgi:hypothetical protein
MPRILLSELIPRILHKLESRRTSAGAAANLWSLPIKAKGKTAMRKALTISILVLALSGSAYAGDMPCDSPTPPATTSVTQEPTTEGNIPNDVAESLTQIALDVLAVLP